MMLNIVSKLIPWSNAWMRMNHSAYRSTVLTTESATGFMLPKRVWSAFEMLQFLMKQRYGAFVWNDIRRHSQVCRPCYPRTPCDFVSTSSWNLAVVTSLPKRPEKTCTCSGWMIPHYLSLQSLNPLSCQLNPEGSSQRLPYLSWRSSLIPSTFEARCTLIKSAGKCRYSVASLLTLSVWLNLADDE